jgi:putative membrane protein
MMYYGDHMTGWGWFAMSVGTVSFWGLLITAFVVLARHLSTSGQAPRVRPPEELLAERFARGEIDETGYRERLGALHAHAPS